MFRGLRRKVLNYLLKKEFNINYKDLNYLINKDIEINLNNLEVNIDFNCNNYLYFDWPFGGYIFEEMLNNKNEKINLIKFSLFEIFGINNRDKLIEYFFKNKEYFIKKLFIYLKENNKIKALLITHDWLAFHQEIINLFKKLNIPVIAILHEGVFQNKNLYYESKKPICDKILVWGELHKSIFIERGYPESNIEIVGSIKLNKYKFYKPSIAKNEFMGKMNLDKNKKTILYCCQFCDMQWGDQDNCLQKQLEQINDIIKIANNKYNVIIRNSPANPNKVIPQQFFNLYNNKNNVIIDGIDINSVNKSTYKTKAEDNLYYSDLIIGMNTTMQLEASLLNKPSFIIKYFDFYPQWNIELGLPIANNYQELENLINQNINNNFSLINNDKKEKFYINYGYNEDINYSPIKNIYNKLL